jgi:hypothetical protein
MAKNPDLPFLDMVEPNIIRHNRIRCDHGWDVDLDDGSSDYRIYNNLLLNGGIKLREGYRRIVTNNIVLNNGLHPHVWPRENGDVFKLNIVFTAHQPAVMTRGLKMDEKWGQEIDYNIYASNHQDRLKFAVNQCDENSIVADPGFVDPVSGDFSLAGVADPALRAIAKTPDIPMVFISPDELSPGSSEEGMSLWLGARLHEPTGEEMSAYGLDFDRKGVGLAMVPEHSRAWKKGLRTGDFITGIDKHDIEGIKTFLEIVEGKYAPQASMVQLYRNQEKIQIELNW